MNRCHRALEGQEWFFHICPIWHWLNRQQFCPASARNEPYSIIMLDVDSCLSFGMSLHSSESILSIENLGWLLLFL